MGIRAHRFGGTIRLDTHDGSPKRNVTPAGSWKKCTDSMPPSRPSPDCFAPPKGAQVSNHPRVDPDHAGFNPLDQTVGSVEVFGPDACGQSVGRGIRQTKGFRLIRERSRLATGPKTSSSSSRMILASPSRSSVQGTSHRGNDREIIRPPATAKHRPGCCFDGLLDLEVVGL